jgi:menaquinone-dependent protoporphyrinogen oxidase
VTILVLYASKYGSTMAIAEHIAEKLDLRGIDARIEPIETAADLEGVDAFVIGSAVYRRHWLPAATDFVRRNRELLASRPVWLFSTGPLRSSASAALPHDAEPEEILEFIRAIRPRDAHVFPGRLDPSRLDVMDRLRRARPTERSALPAGDYRDWRAVDAWVELIAEELASAGPSTAAHAQPAPVERSPGPQAAPATRPDRRPRPPLPETAAQPDYYALLDVDPGAPVSTIRSAYRAQARLDHPDHTSGSTEAMVALNAAWAVLRVPAARAAYDRSRQAHATLAATHPIVAGPPTARGAQAGPFAQRQAPPDLASATLDFGRYAGWSLAEVADRDPDYVEWLARSQAGRSFAGELDRIRHRHGWAGSEHVSA